MLDAIFAGHGKPAMGAEEVRALRDELGWTQEQLAGAVEVSPLEVSAWEAGAVSVGPDHAVALARVAWRERRARAWDAAGARPCAWGADARARLEGDADDVRERLRREELLQAHQKRCAACRRAAEVEQALGPIPVKSRGGFLGFVFRTMDVGEKLPEPLRTLVGMTVFGGWLVLLMLVLALLRFIVEPAAGFEPSLTPVLQLLAVYMGWIWASVLWDRVYPARTFRARGFKAVTTLALVAVMALLGMDPLAQMTVIFLAVVALEVHRQHREEKEADAQRAAKRRARKTPPPAPGADPQTPPFAEAHLLPGSRVPGADEAPPPRAEPVPDGVRSR
ncbi:MAG TPA: helix-turn-helix transcriptional regulator [Longimicrobium sp.]|nr:helix-turn-helix transcriptional regulator [Longimicrobium sp.]